jgi:hypothetical protein
MKYSVGVGMFLAGTLLLIGANLNIAAAETVNFSEARIGTVDAPWRCGATGRGTPLWSIVEVSDSGKTSRLIKQSGIADYPWCVHQDTRLQDGFVETRFKPLSGRTDQAGGVVWRWKDKDNYYVARANALENNVALYYTEAGERRTITYVDAPVALGQWHTLRVEFNESRIRVLLNGKQYIETSDKHLTAAGLVGVWTKADSVTLFEGLSSGPPGTSRP